MNRTSGSNPARRQVCSAPSRFARRSRQTVVLTVATVRPPAEPAVALLFPQSPTVATSQIIPREVSINWGSSARNISRHLRFAAARIPILGREVYSGCRRALFGCPRDNVGQYRGKGKPDSTAESIRVLVAARNHCTRARKDSHQRGWARTTGVLRSWRLPAIWSGSIASAKSNQPNRNRKPASQSPYASR